MVSSPARIRVTNWIFTEAQRGKDRLDTHFAFVRLAFTLFLKFSGDMLGPIHMFEAKEVSKYKHHRPTR